MARHLGLQTVAEGVETAQELEFLAAKGCTIYQGFYFARPMPADAIAQRLLEGRESPDP